VTEEPTPMQRAQHTAAVIGDLAVVRRLLATLHAGNAVATRDICAEVVASGRGVEVTIAAALQALEFLAQLEPDTGRRQDVLDALAFQGLDSAAETQNFLRDIDG
jgi:hypothetical protein